MIGFINAPHEKLFENEHVNDSHMENAVIKWVTRFLDIKVPFKLFTNEQKALAWLQQFKD